MFYAVSNLPLNFYRKDTEILYHSFMHSLVSLLSAIYPLPAMHSLLVTISRFGYIDQPLHSPPTTTTSYLSPDKSGHIINLWLRKVHAAA